MAGQELREQIRLAFPATLFYGPITSCDCEECKDIQQELRHKRWDEIPAEFLDLTCSPMLLTPEAFNAFLPAYILRALDDLSRHAVVVEFTVYSLCPGDPQEDGPEVGARRVSDLLERARLMSAAQIQAIRAFLVFIQENASDAEWFRPFITIALE